MFGNPIHTIRVSVSRTHKVCLGDVADFRELSQQLDETCVGGEIK